MQRTGPKKEYHRKHDEVGKLIHEESQILFAKYQNRYMKTRHNIHCETDTQIDHQIPAIAWINKKVTCNLVDFTVPAGHNKENEKLDKYI